MQRKQAGFQPKAQLLPGEKYLDKISRQQKMGRLHLILRSTSRAEFLIFRQSARNSASNSESQVCRPVPWFRASSFAAPLRQTFEIPDAVAVRPPIRVYAQFHRSPSRKSKMDPPNHPFWEIGNYLDGPSFLVRPRTPYQISNPSKNQWDFCLGMRWVWDSRTFPA